MRTPVHLEGTREGVSAVNARFGTPMEGKIAIRGLRTARGPQATIDRAAVLYLTRKEAQKIAAELDALLAD